MSVISRSDGPGGKMYVPRERYSLMMSFCVVPASAATGGALLVRDAGRARAATSPSR